MSTPEMTSFARRLRALEKGQRRAKTPSLAQSSIEGGALTAVDDDANQTMVIGRQFDDTNAATVITGPTPPIPTIPLVTSSPGAIRVYWDGTFANALVAPMDFSRVTVHVLPIEEYDDATFDPTNQANIYGSFEHATGGEISPILEVGEYAVVLVSWTQAGKFSEESQVALGSSQEFVADTGPDGFAPATAPTIAWAGGIGSVFYRWTPVPNDDPTEYALYVRAGQPPTTSDDTYLVASGLIQQASVRRVLGPDPDDLGGPEIFSDVTPGVDYYGVVLAYDADGPGPDSMPAIAQSVLINSPDIATDAIATRHLQSDSVGVDQLQAGSIDADKLAARLVLASEMLLGNLDNTGLDPTTLNPNLLPTMTPDKIAPVGTTVEGSWNSNGTAAGWTITSEQFSPPNDDGYWERMAPGSLQSLRADRVAALTGTGSQVVLRTRVTVEPLTEYRFELNSSMPGMDPAMPLAGTNNDILNSVKWFVSTDDSYQSPEVFSWKTFVKDDTPRPDLTKFDRGVIRTGAGQTTLYIKLEINGNYMLASSGGFQVVFPELRKVDSTTIPALPVNPSSVSATDVTADPAATTWKASAVWSGTTSSIVRSSSVITTSSSGGAFAPSKFSTPGRYAIPGESQSFQQAKGVRVTTQSAGTGLGLRVRIMAPAMDVPALSPMESLLLGVGFSGITQAVTGLDDFTLTASWFDSTNALISNQAIIDLDAAGLVAQGITNLTENYFTPQLSPPAGATKVVVWAEYTNGPSGNIAASTNQTPTLFGLRLYTLGAINYNYGNMSKRHVKINSTGVYLINAQGQVQISIPTDENETPKFKGGIEADWARFLGGASFEGISEIAKDASVSLSDGIKSPIGTPTITQDYEQYTMQRVPETYVGFSSRPTLNPSQITGMVWNGHWGQFFITENRGGGIAIWRMRSDGTLPWVSFLEGFEWATPLYDSGSPSNANLIAGQFGGNFWAYVSNGTSTILNRIPDGVVPADVHPNYVWNNANDRLYVFYPHIDGSGRNVYKRLVPTMTPSGTMTLESTTVGGSGTSRSSSTSGLAGSVIIGGDLYTAARGTTAADVYTFAAGDGGALDTGDRWPLAGNPVGFCYDDDSFWQIDSSGKLTRYSDWTWPETNHKIYAGITWYDSDPAGTGVHETNLTTLASATLKKRISGVRLTLPQVPDNGGVDDPDRWRAYAFKGTGAALPGNRTSFFLQAQGGLATQQTTYIIPANGLVTSGTNPPASNNFPATGPGRFFSAAVDSLSAPKIELKGNGDYRLGHISTRTGRTITLAMTGTTSIGSGTDVTDGGGYTDTIAEDLTSGWVGLTYGSGIFTCIEKGLYQFEYGFNWAAFAGFSRRWIFVALNQTTPTITNSYRNKTEVSGGGNFLATLRLDIPLNVGDTIRAGFRQDTGGSLSSTTSQGPVINGVQYARYVQIVRKA